MVLIAKRKNNPIVKNRSLLYMIVFIIGSGIVFWVAVIMSVTSTQELVNKKAITEPLPPIRGVKSPDMQTEKQDKPTTTLKHQSEEALQLLDNGKIRPMSSDSERLSKYRSIISKECFPGRDDAQGEINPTTKKNRECLRFVPKDSKPRIGILITPGFIANALGSWIKTALVYLSGLSGNEIEIVITHHVPKYGYGKSHGWSKLIRVNTESLTLMDTFLYEKLRESSEEATVEVLERSNSFKTIPIPTKPELQSMLKLLLRWQCRISHVTAHTSLISISLHGILKDPVKVIEKIYQFVFENNWEWGGKTAMPWKDIDPMNEAMNFIDSEKTHTPDSSYLRRAIEEVVLIRGVAEDFLGNLNGNTTHLDNIEAAFNEEMKLSKDLTIWPCPSFWAGIDKFQLNSMLIPGKYT